MTDLAVSKGVTVSGQPCTIFSFSSGHFVDYQMIVQAYRERAERCARARVIKMQWGAYAFSAHCCNLRFGRSLGVS